jgi:hypothetical protein
VFHRRKWPFRASCSVQVRLKVQEIPYGDPESNNYFVPSPERPFVATPAAIEMHGEETIRKCHKILMHMAERFEGLDYLQVFTGIDKGEDLWFIEEQIDKVRGNITALIPSDY